MELTYQQVLADIYDETSKNMLVHHTEYDEEDKPAYEKYDYIDNELPDPEEFNKFHGDRNKPEHLVKIGVKQDFGGKSGIKHQTDIRTIVLNIDGDIDEAKLSQINEIAATLLSNPVIEDFTVQVRP